MHSLSLSLVHAVFSSSFMPHESLQVLHALCDNREEKVFLGHGLHFGSNSELVDVRQSLLNPNPLGHNGHC